MADMLWSEVRYIIRSILLLMLPGNPVPLQSSERLLGTKVSYTMRGRYVPFALPRVPAYPDTLGQYRCVWLRRCLTVPYIPGTAFYYYYFFTSALLSQQQPMANKCYKT